MFMAYYLMYEISDKKGVERFGVGKIKIMVSTAYIVKGKIT
jgi:hypothetical protein